MMEGKVASDPVAIDAPGGLLFEWWSVFWDIFIARINEKHFEAAATYIETQQMKRRDQNPSLGGPINVINSKGMMGQPSASVLALKMYKEQMKHPHSLDLKKVSPLIDPNRMAFLKSASNHQRQLVQGNSGSMSAALQQMQGRPHMIADIKTDVNLSGAQKSLPMDLSLIYGQAILQSKSGLGNVGLNQGITGLPLKGWPLTRIDHLWPSIGLQVQTPNIQNQNQFLLASLQQQALAQVQAQGQSTTDVTPCNRTFKKLLRQRIGVCIS
ncbi:hypothetical protein T459_17625 [Capsicum annuum]|uniref:Transcriptional corepressor LEUNIG-like n=1 Tax=Capsicum annuum TaxID=4072 RepID=A0A2G2ZC36_CAPAN|nr:hypothetical protein T459_17625 [Capsicum annuum]